MFSLGILFILLVAYHGQTLDVSGISSVRFAPNSNTFPQNRDGILELKFNHNWSSVCNFAFDHVAASTACYMMGYPAYGFPILNHKGKSSQKTMLSSFNCTDRVSLGPNPPEPLSTHLGNCEFTTNIPSVCVNNQRDVAIVCLEPQEEIRVTTLPPATFKPVICPNLSEHIRLVGGSSVAGRVEIKHPETQEWGTICADGFGTNEARAICRMLCSSSDDLAYAHTVVNTYPTVTNISIPIHLAQISCSTMANSLNDCILGDGWGNVRGCTHAMDVGVVCGPEEFTVRNPVDVKLTCEEWTAVIYFQKEQLPNLNKGMIGFNPNPQPASCEFNLTQSGDEIILAFSMDKCGGDFGSSNLTTLSVQTTVTVNYSQPFVLPVTCLMDRSDVVQSDVKAAPTSLMPPIVSSRHVPTNITFYSDRLFKNQIDGRLNVLPYQKVYTRVALCRPQRNSKLVVRDCWLANSETAPASERTALISNGCPTNNRVKLLPISRNALGFSFETDYFGNASRSYGDDRSLQLFVGCNTRICTLRETDPSCLQFCL